MITDQIYDIKTKRMTDILTDRMTDAESTLIQGADYTSRAVTSISPTVSFSKYITDI